MSERQDKRRRYNQRLAFIAAFTSWIECEPSWWQFISKVRWLAKRPREEDYCDSKLEIPDWIIWSIEDHINDEVKGNQHEPVHV